MPFDIILLLILLCFFDTVFFLPVQLFFSSLSVFGTLCLTVSGQETREAGEGEAEAAE